jgi:hypothetical protein
VSKTFEQALQVLIGEQLSSVEFVQDYVQLRFDGSCLTIYSAAHQTKTNGFSFAWGEIGYRDALCSLITHKVREINVAASESLSLAFDEGSVWSLSLRNSDYVGPEALMFTDEMSEFYFVI